MLIYFDESYDNDHEFLIFGALFNPHPKYLHREFAAVKRQYRYFSQDKSLREIKYNYVTKRKQLRIAKASIDIFHKSTSWFRAIVIEEKLINLNRFGTFIEKEKIKRARMYKKFAELLIAHNTENIFQATLFVDELKRCKGDEFIEIMKQEFCVPFGKHSIGSEIPTLKDVREIHSHLEQYQVCQINDVLTGCILNNLKPTRRPEKNELRDYLIQKMNVPNLLRDSWEYYNKSYVEKYWPKFNIWYWKP